MIDIDVGYTVIRGLTRGQATAIAYVLYQHDIKCVVKLYPHEGDGPVYLEYSAEANCLTANAVNVIRHMTPEQWEAYCASTD